MILNREAIDFIGVIVVFVAMYIVIGMWLSVADAIPESEDRRTNIWRVIIWPVVLLVVLSHKIGPFCVWIIKELREAPIAIARALRLNEEK